MFPTNIVTRCTFYIFHKDLQTDNVTCEKAILEGVYWNEDSATIFSKTGRQAKDEALIYVPADEKTTGRKWIYRDNWAKLPADKIKNHWTVDIRQAEFTRLVRGACPFDFTSGTQQHLSQQMTAFDREFPDAKRPRDVNPQLLGTPIFHHVQIQAGR